MVYPRPYTQILIFNRIPSTLNSSFPNTLNLELKRGRVHFSWTRIHPKYTPNTPLFNPESTSHEPGEGQPTRRCRRVTYPDSYITKYTT